MAPKIMGPGADDDWPGAEGIADEDGIGVRSWGLSLEAAGSGLGL
jgi:hypothetical protein